ncbi:MAG: hypothetical protein JSR46_04070, partial [Verrucomicrobia bacterium]|nr:hypothetical protein [Verrucomicrobiota bacterium]
IDFIELFYLFLQLKIIELVQPTVMSFSCKDAIDIGMPAASEFFLLLKFINDRKLSEEEEEYVKSLLHSSAISHRGRPLFEERFARVTNLVRLLEGVERADILEKIAPLYDTNILSSVVTIPQL